MPRVSVAAPASPVPPPPVVHPAAPRPKLWVRELPNLLVASP